MTKDKWTLPLILLTEMESIPERLAFGEINTIIQSKRYDGP